METESGHKNVIYVDDFMDEDEETGIKKPLPVKKNKDEFERK